MIPVRGRAAVIVTSVVVRAFLGCCFAAGVFSVSAAADCPVACWLYVFIYQSVHQYKHILCTIIQSKRYLFQVQSGNGYVYPPPACRGSRASMALRLRTFFAYFFLFFFFWTSRSNGRDVTITIHTHTHLWATYNSRD